MEEALAAYYVSCTILSYLSSSVRVHTAPQKNKDLQTDMRQKSMVQTHVLNNNVNLLYH